MRECATYLQTPLGTLQAWACPKDVGPLVTVFPSPGRQASVPFVGFAEAFVLGPLRKAGVQTQRIRLAVKKLNDELGLDHALASRRVYADGAELIFDDASSAMTRSCSPWCAPARSLADVIRGTWRGAPTVTTAELRACAYPPNPGRG